MSGTAARALALAAALMLAAQPAGALHLVETPSLAAAVAEGSLPPVAARVPDHPIVVNLAAEGKEPGQPGGEITWLAGRVRDIRMMNAFGYARLVGYTPELNIVPDILDSLDIQEERIFTFHLRPGHRWSDGAPFTAEDFRYQWFDVETNPELKPFGPDSRLLVDGERPVVEILDQHTVRYRWSKPNPELLPALAAARPLYLYAPSHYLRQFHAAYADPAALAALVAASGERSWAALHVRRSDLFESSNTTLPSLEPWVNTTAPPSERFVFQRNPFFHRVDIRGHQLPYIDRVNVTIADAALIPAKAGAGDSDLQARHLRFDSYTFLKRGDARNHFHVRLWPAALGAEIALYPNLNANDPVWRALNRDVRYRRALSLAIDREEINQVIFYGLARPSANTALPQSPLYSAERAAAWIEYDPDRANRLLDEIGLTQRRGDGIRLLPDGRPLEVIIETAGERSEEIDALQLMAESWRKIGVALFTNTSQRDVCRTRIYSGDAMMSVWFGFDNALFTPDTVPNELAPVDQSWLEYPKWGQYVQTGGMSGEPPDMPLGIRLMELYNEWRSTAGRERRGAITSEMLDIHADQVTSIGIVQGVKQPIVVADRLHNVPVEGIYSWDPGAHFGMYRPETFWVSQ